MKDLVKVLLVSAVLIAGGCSKDETGIEVEEKKEGGITVENIRQEKREFDRSGTIEETVIYDADGIIITAKEIEYGYSSINVNLDIVNNSTENYGFLAGTIGYSATSINGFMVEGGYMNTDIPAGKSASDSISFSYEDLEIYGIYAIGEIDLGMYISDDHYNEKVLELLPVKTCLYGRVDTPDIKEGFLSSDFIEENECELLYSGEDVINVSYGVDIVSEAVIEKGDVLTLLMEIKNETDYTIDVESSNISVNGLIVCDGGWSAVTLKPHCRCLESITVTDIVDKKELIMYGINEIGRLKLRVFAAETDNYSSTDEGTVFSLTIPGRDTGMKLKSSAVYDDNGIRMYPVTFTESDYDWNNDLKLLLVIENTGKEDLYISNVYNSLSVNDRMNDYTFFGVEVKAGEKATAEITLDGDDLQINGVNSIEEIKKLEMQFEIKASSNWKTINKPVVTMEWE